jgi:hypothetical protein
MITSKTKKYKYAIETIRKKMEKLGKIGKNRRKYMKTHIFKIVFGTFLVTISNKKSKKVPKINS